MARLSFALCFFCLSFIALPVLAAEPLEIKADKALEWHRDDQKIIARGNVSATQGDASIRSNLMTATYEEGEKENKFIPQTLRAEQNVRIKTPDGTAFGDVATYDIKKKVAKLSGKKLRLEADNLVLSAKKEFRYNIAKGRLYAVGDAKLTQKTKEGSNTLQADTLSARFVRHNGRNRQLERMEANGSVIITTPTETITGDKGFYNRITNQAELSGNVKVIRGPNTLQGELATVDLNTNISTLSGGESGSSQVTGTFYPE